MGEFLVVREQCLVLLLKPKVAVHVRNGRVQPAHNAVGRREERGTLIVIEAYNKHKTDSFQ